jgi:hypothetical protein
VYGERRIGYELMVSMQLSACAEAMKPLMNKREHREYTDVVVGKWWKAGVQHMRLNNQCKGQNLAALFARAKKWETICPNKGGKGAGRLIFDP